MLCRAFLIAAATLLIFSLSDAPAQACTNDKSLCEPDETGAAKPVLFGDYVDRVFNRKPSATPAAPPIEPIAKRDDRWRAWPARGPKAATPPAAAISSQDRGAVDVPDDIVPVIVKTTSEIFQGATSVSVISPEEWNEIDRLAAARNAAPQPSTDGSGRAEQAAATTEVPRPQPPSASTILELVLMTFSGALAAVTALRLFAA